MIAVVVAATVVVATRMLAARVLAAAVLGAAMLAAAVLGAAMLAATVVVLAAVATVLEAAANQLRSPERSESRQAKRNRFPLRSLHEGSCKMAPPTHSTGGSFPLQLISPGNAIRDPSRGVSFS